MTTVSVNRKSRFVGSLLASACGDVLGAAVEMQSRAEILRQHPGLLRDFIPYPRGLGFGHYTDDTEMTLALTRSILRMGTVDPADCSTAYAKAFTEPRGYGRSAVQVLTALQSGADWQTTGTMLFAAGSFGNGAAMRIAPVGLLYGALPAEQLRMQVTAAVAMTHTHPEAIDAAVLQARSVWLMLNSIERLDAVLFVKQLIDYLPGSSLQEQLLRLIELFASQAAAEQVAASFGCGVRSRDSWPAALWAALQFVDDPEEAIIQAVNLGGDTDTVGAMTGALVGARYAADWLPRRWTDRLESGRDGRDALICAAEQLAEISVR